MFQDVMSYIKYDCKIYNNQRAGIKLKIRTKSFITKGTKERYIIDGFKLDNISKEKFGFEWVVEINSSF